MLLIRLFENWIDDYIAELPALKSGDGSIDSSQAAMLIAADDDLFDAVALYTAHSPTVFDDRPEQAAKIVRILRRVQPFTPYFRTFYRGEPKQSPKRPRRFRSWSSNRSTAEEFARDYLGSGVVLKRNGPVQGVSIEDIATWRMRLTDESHYAGLQAEWLLLD